MLNTKHVRTLFVRRTVASCIINQVHYSRCSSIYKGDLNKSASGPVKHLPNMHEHIAEEPPDLCSVSGMIHQRTLHEIWLVGLKHPFIEHHAVTHKHYDLKQTQTHTVLNSCVKQNQKEYHVWRWNRWLNHMRFLLSIILIHRAFMAHIADIVRIWSANQFLSKNMQLGVDAAIHLATKMIFW